MACWMLSAFFCAVVGSAGGSASADCTIVQFTAPWCEPCQQIEPALQQLRRDGWAIQTVDCDRQPELVQQFRIENLPTIAILCRNQEVDRLVGAAPYERILERIQRAAARNQSGGGRDDARTALPATISSPGSGSEQSTQDRTPQLTTNSTQSSAPIVRVPIVRGQSPGTSPGTSSTGLSSPGLSGFPLLASASSTAGPTNGSGLNRVNTNRGNNTNRGGTANQVAEPSHSTLTLEQAVARAAAATVRIRVDEANTTAYGTGTIVDVRGQEALILTCGHLFRDMQPQSQLTIDLFPGTPQEVNLPSELIDFKAEGEDIGLISFRIPTPIEPVPILGRGQPVSIGQPAFSFGCDHGANPTRRDTQIKSINRYLGADNIEIVGAPVMGRSGGGLFDIQGRLIGVCNAANTDDDEGIYAAADVVYTQIERLGLSELFTGSQPTVQNIPLASLNSPKSGLAPSIASNQQSGVSPDYLIQQSQQSGVSPDGAPQRGVSPDGADYSRGGAGGWNPGSGQAAGAGNVAAAGGDLQWPDQSAVVPASLTASPGFNAPNSSAINSSDSGTTPGLLVDREQPREAGPTGLQDRTGKPRQLICIVREPGGQDKVLTIDAPPAQLLELIQQSSAQAMR